MAKAEGQSLIMPVEMRAYLFSPVECAPYWLRDPCPHGKKCLHSIAPGQVEATVKQLPESHRTSRSLSQPAEVAGDAGVCSQSGRVAAWPVQPWKPNLL